jgi:probable HAF family extracellular repeat protein
MWTAGIAAALLVAGGARGAIRYSVVDLGTLGGPFAGTEGYGAINAAGQVTGWSLAVNGEGAHVFRTAGRGRTIDADTDDLGTLNSFDGWSGYGSSGMAINNLGQVVGSMDPGNNENHRAFRTGPDGVITTASVLGSSGQVNSYAWDINDAGVTVGQAGTSKTDYHAFRTAPNGPIDRSHYMDAAIKGVSTARAVNASGQVTGYASALGHAFRTQPGQDITAAADLGSLIPVGFSEGYGINDAGQVVGTAVASLESNAHHAFRTTAGGKIDAASDLGTLGGRDSYAYAINSLGQTVGVSQTANQGQHAFLANPQGRCST